MTARDPRPVLQDILRAIAVLRNVEDEAVHGGLPEFSPTRLVVERAIEIISEASRRLDEDLKARHPTIPWRDIAIIGNHIRHGYDRVDEARLLAVISEGLAPLERVIAAELSRLDQG